MKYFAVVLLGALACRAPQPSEPLSATHRAAMIDSVDRRLAEFRAAVATMRSDSVIPFYSADADFRWIEDGVVRYTRRDEIAAAIAASAPFMHDVTLQYDGTLITPLAPGIASVTTGFAQKYTAPDGAAHAIVGSITAVMVHSARGWQFASGHTSRAVGPTGSAAGSAAPS